MSRVFSKNRKELAAIQLISAENAWVLNNSGKYVLNPDYVYVGKVNKTVMPNVILKANQADTKNHFVEDFSGLPKATKEKVVDFFLNEKTENDNNRRVVYLVRGDSKVKGKRK
jgi:hypothetical protein